MRDRERLNIFMKKHLGRKFILAGLICAAMPQLGLAQDFFRELGTSRSSGGIGPVTPSDYSYDDGSPSGLRPLRPGQELSEVEQTEEDERYNFALGPVRFSLAAGVGLEWNDNISLADKNRESDFIFRPTVDVDASWRLSELNTLHFAVQASYAKYFDHSELDSDGVLISPNSELAFTFFVGSVKFTLRDRFSYQEDTYDLAVPTTEATYQRYENQAGIQMDWQINQQLDLSAGYDHYNLWTTQDAFDNQDRTVDTVFVRPAVQLTPALKVGLNAAYSLINFDSDSRSDGDNVLLGPFVEFQLSEYTNLYLEGGFQDLSYDNSSNYSNAAVRALNLTRDEAVAVADILRDDEGSSSWYVKFEIQNKPSEFFKHRISGSKTAEIGFDANFYNLYHIEYNADWKISDKTELGPSVFYEYYESSGANAEEANRYGATFGIRHHFSNSITLGLDYRFIYKDSNLEGADYYQNLAFLSIYYKF